MKPGLNIRQTQSMLNVSMLFWRAAVTGCLQKNTLIAHNMRAYGGYFLSNCCVNNPLKPDTIYNENKIMSMEIKGLDITIIDSINFISQALKQFPKTFGLTELKKGYFPHYFNKPCNQNYKTPLPSKSQYGYRRMSRKDKKEFEAWYDQKIVKNYVFNVQKELLEYYEDVII